MTKIRIEKLEAIKRPIVQKLYKQYYPSGKAKSNELTYVSYSDNTLCAVVRFRSVDAYRLLTGMLVIPEYRQKGVGREILGYCSRYVLSENTDYCFAYPHLEEFYTEYGFSKVEYDSIPGPLRLLYQRYCRGGKQLIPMKFTKSKERDM